MAGKQLADETFALMGTPADPFTNVTTLEHVIARAREEWA